MQDSRLRTPLPAQKSQTRAWQFLLWRNGTVEAQPPQKEAWGWGQGSHLALFPASRTGSQQPGCSTWGRRGENYSVMRRQALEKSPPHSETYGVPKKAADSPRVTVKTGHLWEGVSPTPRGSRQRVTVSLFRWNGMLLWTELCPPKLICWSSNSQRDGIWRRGL